MGSAGITADASEFDLPFEQIRFERELSQFRDSLE